MSTLGNCYINIHRKPKDFENIGDFDQKDFENIGDLGQKDFEETFFFAYICTQIKTLTRKDYEDIQKKTI